MTMRPTASILEHDPNTIKQMPLTQAQLSIWLGQMLDCEDSSLNLAECVDILGSIDAEKFEMALRQVVAATDSLHLHFVETDNGPRQFFRYDANWELTHLDFGGAPDAKEAADAWVRRDTTRPFRFDGGPLYRFALLRLSPDHHYWYANIHHVVIDATGWQMLLARFAAVYTILVEGRPSERIAGGSWREVLDEEQAYRKSNHFRRDRQFWQAHLANAPTRVTLSVRPARRASGLIKSVGWVPGSVDLQKVSRNYGTSPAAVLAVATAIYMHRMTGEREMLVGMLVSGRMGPTMRSVIGPVANTMPLKISVTPSDPVGHVIRRAARDVLAAMRHQRYRMEDIRRDRGLRPNDGELVSAIVNYLPADNDIKFADCKLLRNTLTTGRVEDLQILFLGGSRLTGLRIDLVANRELYSQAELHQHRDRYLDILSQIASAKAETKVSDVNLSDASVVGARDDMRLSIDTADRGASRSDDAGKAAAPPSTTTEVAVARIWSDVLRISSIHRGDDFFDIGGDSLLANMVMTRVKKAFALDFHLSVMFEAPTLAAFASRIDALAGESSNPLPATVIEPVAVEGPAPLSFSQHRMWLIQSLDPENTAYNISGALRLNGRLDVDALSEAFAEVYNRHEVLHTTYDLVNGEIVQRLQEPGGVSLTLIDLTSQRGDDLGAEALRQANRLARTPIDLTKGPGFSGALIRMGPAEHLLQLTVHHIAGDQWSMGVIARELASLYNAARTGRAADLPQAPIRYRDFAMWQQQQLESAELVSQLEYWRLTLEGVQPLELPTDRPRPRFQTLKGSICHASIPASLQAGLKELSLSESTTLFMTMFAGFATLLHRLTGQSDIPIGLPIAGRMHGDVEQVVGTFVNTLVMRVDLTGDPTFRELLGRVRTTALSAFAHQDVPFDKLVQVLVENRDTSRAPLVQVMFNMMNAPMHGIEFDGIDWEYFHIDRGGAQFELSMSVDPPLNQSVTVEYNSDLFDRDTVERLIKRYLRLLEAAVAEPATRLSDLDVLPADERQLVLQTWNATSAETPQKTFIAMFEQQAAQQPDAPAVTFEGTTLSYGELDGRATLLASELRALEVGRGVIVGVYLSRSLTMLVTLLAVQKSGGVYVPLDPELPPRRLAYMISDSGVRVLVADGGTASKLEIPLGVKVLEVDSSTSTHGSANASDVAGNARACDPAYIIYTSGSTGKPKGVVVSHGSLANFLCSMRKVPGLTETDVLAAVTTISFDIAGLELYLPLLVGARIELVAPTTASDGSALSELLQSSGATVMQATPATWRILLDAEWQGAAGFRAFCGGETLSRELADALLVRIGELWNLYGPTETTIWSTACRVEPGDAHISVGRPIDNTQVYILNGKMPAPIGLAGEICIGGAGVAIGYHGLPELTDARFEANPFATQPGARIYRTGDLGAWGADGRLYHMGRIDHQVKIRGFRIELGEIEAVLHSHAAVKQAVVVAHEVGPADTRLVSYVVYERGAELTVSDLRRFLRQHLPEYMIPSMAIAIDRLPLTPNGKLDRRGLPAPFLSASRPANAYEPPAPGTETMLAGVWRELLKVKTVAADDNFFDLGGHSLLALQVVAQVKKLTGTRLEPRSLFFQSLRQIAAGLANGKVGA